MNMVRFDPFNELDMLTTRLNRLFGRGLAREMRGEMDVDGFGDWMPSLDVEETDNEYLVKTDLPQVSKADIKVGIENGVLTIEGERKQEKEEKGKKFHRVERSFGKFSRRLTVPTDVDAKKVMAEFKEGVLNVHLPKSAEAKPRAIEVKVA